MLTNLAFESLPVHTDEILCFFALELCRQPVPKAFEVDKTDTSLTLARDNARVFLS